MKTIGCLKVIAYTEIFLGYRLYLKLLIFMSREVPLHDEGWGTENAWA